MALERAQLGPARQVPDLSVWSSEAETALPPVRRHRHRLDRLGMALERAQLAPRSPGPRPSASVLRGRDRAPAVRRHRHRHDPIAWPASVRSSRPVARSQTLSVLSSEAETARRPSGRHRHRRDPTAMALRACAARARSPGPRPSASGRREAETARRPSGVTATAMTRSPWPSSVRQLAPARQVPDLQRPVLRGRDRAPPVRRHRHRHDPVAHGPRACAARAPLARSQTFSVRSSSPRPRAARPGVTATAMTQPAWPSSVRSSRPAARSQTFSVLSYEPETARRPSGRHRHRHDPAAMALERAQLRAPLQVPDLERPVARGRDRAPPVRASPPPP